MGQSKVTTIPIDEHFEHTLISAMRYAMGRRTYIVDETASYISTLLPKLSDWCISVLRRDLEDELALGRRIGSFDCLGDPCDVQRWKNLAEEIDTEVKRRKL